MDNQQAKLILDMGWLIGFWEGEGCFALRVQRYQKQKPALRPEMSVLSTDFELADRAAEILKSRGIGVYVYERQPSTAGYNRKRIKVVNIVGIKRAHKALLLLLPYMTDSRKKRCAETLLEFCELRLNRENRQSPYTTEEFAIFQRLRDLNGYQLRQSSRDSTRGVFDYNTKVESAAA